MGSNTLEVKVMNLYWRTHQFQTCMGLFCFRCTQEEEEEEEVVA